MARMHTRQRGETRSPSPRRVDDRGAKKAPNPSPPGGALIGRRVGQSSKDLGDALKRPEKLHGDFPVDTSEKGIAASDRRAGGGSTARRNSRKNASSARYALEDSATEPSRKSTRRGANWEKPDNQLRGRHTRTITSSEERAQRSSDRAVKVRGGSSVKRPRA